MKKALMFTLALAVIPVVVDAQATLSASCADINIASPLEDVRSCAKQGDAHAQTVLGAMYANGEGVPQDYAEAVRWYRLAAEQGNAVAQFNLGVQYANGEGVPEDDVEAVRWYRLSAEQVYFYDDDHPLRHDYFPAAFSGVPNEFLMDRFDWLHERLGIPREQSRAIAAIYPVEGASSSKDGSTNPD